MYFPAKKLGDLLSHGLPTFLEAVLLRLECTCESPGGLVKMHALIPYVWVEPTIVIF